MADENATNHSSVLPQSSRVTMSRFLVPTTFSTHQWNFCHTSWTEVYYKTLQTDLTILTFSSIKYITAGFPRDIFPRYKCPFNTPSIVLSYPSPPLGSKINHRALCRLKGLSMQMSRAIRPLPMSIPLVRFPLVHPSVHHWPPTSEAGPLSVCVLHAGGTHVQVHRTLWKDPSRIPSIWSWSN